MGKHQTAAAKRKLKRAEAQASKPKTPRPAPVVVFEYLGYVITDKELKRQIRAHQKAQAAALKQRELMQTFALLHNTAKLKMVTECSKHTRRLISLLGRKDTLTYLSDLIYRKHDDEVSTWFDGQVVTNIIATDMAG